MSIDLFYGHRLPAASVCCTDEEGWKGLQVVMASMGCVKVFKERNSARDSRRLKVENYDVVKKMELKLYLHHRLEYDWPKSALQQHMKIY